MSLPHPSLPADGQRSAIERSIRLVLAGKAIRRIHALIEAERRDRLGARRIALAAAAIGIAAAILLASLLGPFGAS